MKRFLLIIAIMFLTSFGACFSAATAADDAATKINTIGQNVLKKNSLPKEVKFNIVDSTEVNAYADANNNIVVYTGLMKLVEKDEELAGILSHEIGHIMKSHCYKQTFFNMALSLLSSGIKNEAMATGAQVASSLAANKVSREQEYDADYTSADLVYKAGYNPLGLISALNKISSNYVDILSDHPSGDKRLMALYDYINYNYPDAVQKGFDTASYKSFIAYAEPTLTQRKNNAKANEKYIKTQQKLKKKRDKAAKKMMRTNDPWAMGYSTLMLMSGN